MPLFGNNKNDDVLIDDNDVPSALKKEQRATGHCVKCGRYVDVPVIDGVPQCKCHNI